MYNIVATKAILTGIYLLLRGITGIMFLILKSNKDKFDKGDAERYESFEELVKEYVETLAIVDSMEGK